MRMTASAVLAVLVAAPVFAQSGAVPPATSPEMAGHPAPPSAPPAPAKEMAQLKFFEGEWTCSGQVPTTPFGPAHPTRSAIKAVVELDGFWLSGSVDEEKTVENAQPMHGRFHWTYDAGQRIFRSSWIDNSGGWANQTSNGWQGSKLNWSGTWIGAGQKIPVRDTFEKTPDGQMKHSFEGDFGGKTTSLGVEVCKKAK